jgi:uncharacterized membrane protein
MSDIAKGKKNMAKRNKKLLALRNLIMGIGVAALIGLAVREQLQMPPEERTWHGTLYGIPYDFRWPTIERLREAFWNKNTARVLVPHAFGMGWSINFYPLINPPTAEHMSETTVTK